MNQYLIKITLNDFGKGYDILYKAYYNLNFLKNITDLNENTFELPEGYRLIDTPGSIILCYALVNKLANSVSKDFNLFLLEVSDWEVKNDEFNFLGYTPTVTSTPEPNGWFLTKCICSEISLNINGELSVVKSHSKDPERILDDVYLNVQL